jgi:hypothetical protein
MYLNEKGLIDNNRSNNNTKNILYPRIKKLLALNFIISQRQDKK